MKVLKTLIVIFVGTIIGVIPLYAQDDQEIIDLLTREVEVENPVYMPVLGIGLGYINFHGDVNNAFQSFTTSKPAIRVNVATFLGKRHNLRGNFVFVTGDIAGTQRTVPEGYLNLSDTSRNLNFKSTLYSFGLNLHYSFKPLIKGKYFEPFISIGIETIQFDSKADNIDGNGFRYHYWDDGTIRIESQQFDNAGLLLNPNASQTQRDYNYETNLRKENRSGLGKYGQFAVGIPIDVGFDFNISNRVTLRVGTSLHYVFSDLVDDMSSKSEDELYKGKSGNDMFTHTYASLHLDLFSSDKTKIVEDLFADIEDFDYTMYEDQDNDGVFDGWDQCPNTPEGIPVDSIGCPFDSDGDGVPDYIDREVSASGAIVDEYGVEVNESMIVGLLDAQAIRRNDVETYLLMQRAQNKVRREVALPIPEQYKKVDKDGDNYISFDELLNVIDSYFDGDADYSPNNIKELNDFFFDQ